MRALAISLTLLLLAGCTNITATSKSESAISLRYDDALWSAEEVAQKASAECDGYGRASQFRSREKESPLGFTYAHFDCVRR